MKLLFLKIWIRENQKYSVNTVTDIMNGTEEYLWKHITEGVEVFISAYVDNCIVAVG